jgi:phage/plasmid-like protein (TIGR03299 family)
MAHALEINPNTGQASYIGGHAVPAWHRLGTTVDAGFTAEEGMRVAGLADWNVRKEPLYTLKEVTLPDGMVDVEARQVDGQYATVRDNPFTPGQEDHLGVVGESYVPFQNEEGAEFLNLFVGESGAHFDTMGSIRNGRQTFIGMKLPEFMNVGGEDRLDLYLTLLNSHDGSLKITPLLSTVRVVCANTFDWALRANLGIASLRHTAGAKARIEEVRQLLGATFSAKDEFSAEAERMIQAEMTKGQFEKKVINGVYSAIAPKVTAGQSAKNTWAATRDGLMDYFLGDIEGADSKIGKTAWGAFQAVTWMEDHQRNIRTASTASDDRKRDRAERSVAGGIGANLKNKAWSALHIEDKKTLVAV